MTQDEVKQTDRAAARAEREAQIAAMKAETDRMRANLAETRKRIEAVQADWEATLQEAGLTQDQLRERADATGVTAFVNAVHRQYRKENPPRHKTNGKGKGKAKKTHKKLRTMI